MFRRIATIAVLLLAATSVLFAAPVSRVWPMSDEGAAYMIRNTPNVSTIGFPVDDAVRPDISSLRVVVEAPAYFELLSNTYRYSRPMPPAQVELIMRDGRPYKRFTFGSLPETESAWTMFYTQWIPKPFAADLKNPGVFAWHFETPSGPEEEQSYPIVLLPELSQQNQPKRIGVRFWTSTNLNIDPPHIPTILDLLRRAGVNQISGWETSIDRLVEYGVRDYGMKVVNDQSGLYGWPSLRDVKEEMWTVDKDGNVVPNSQDPQYIIDRDGEPWKRDLSYAADLAKKVDIESQDSEWSARWDLGFSAAAIKAFAAKNNLDAALLTPQIIWSEHRKKWGDFRAEQMLTLISYFNKAIKEANPNCPLIYLPGSPYTTTDSELMSDMIVLGKNSQGDTVYLTFPFPTARMQEEMDGLTPMWYGHGVGQVKEAFDWSKAITPRIKIPLMPLFLGQGREFYYPGGDSGETIRAMVWAGLLGGSKGYGFWLNEFSPIQLMWLSYTNREIAVVEDILMDGKPDPSGVTFVPMPRNRQIITSGDLTKSYNIPDLKDVTRCRAYSLGDQRLIGIVNLDLSLDAYYTVKVAGLPKGDYVVRDVTNKRLITPDAASSVFSAQTLAKGIQVHTPAQYGVSILQVSPADTCTPLETDKISVQSISAAYSAYKIPDDHSSTIAEEGDVIIRYDIVGEHKERMILIETPKQRVWVRPEAGGTVSRWEVSDGDVQLIAASSQVHGTAMDLFWAPADAHWSGEEKSMYEVVSAEVRDGNATITLRQPKIAPTLSGLVVTKTITTPTDDAEIHVDVEIENVGPRPVATFSYWVHNVFDFTDRTSTENLAEVYMNTSEGIKMAQMETIIWTKPNEPLITGNEYIEKNTRNGVTTSDWIVERNPVNGHSVICGVERPAVAQFYSWRSSHLPNDLSIEWMYPMTDLHAGKTWSTSYKISYANIASVDALKDLMGRD